MTSTFKWEGIELSLKIKNDVSNFKVVKVLGSSTSTEEQSTMKVSISDIRITQNKSELVFKEAASNFEMDYILEAMYHNNKDELSLPEATLTVSKLIFILDMSLLNQMAASLLRVVKVLEPIIGQNVDQEELKLALFAKVNSSYIQVPLKDSKNSLYTMIDGL